MSQNTFYSITNRGQSISENSQVQSWQVIFTNGFIGFQHLEHDRILLNTSIQFRFLGFNEMFANSMEFSAMKKGEMSRWCSKYRRHFEECLIAIAFFIDLQLLYGGGSCLYNFLHCQHFITLYISEYAIIIWNISKFLLSL